MKKVITRVWHGRTPAGKSDAYLEFLLERGVKDYKATPGNLSVHIWRRIENDIAHFYTVTTWENMESIKKFAGEDEERAHYYTEDRNFLLEFEPVVTHYETFIP